MKTSRPAINIPYSVFEKLLEALSVLILVLCGLLVLKSYQDLPEMIPMHFNFAGKIDAMGPKANLIKLYSIIALLYLFVTIISRYPQFFNYPTAITDENARVQYRLARMMVNIIKVEILVLLTLVVSAVISTAGGGSTTGLMLGVLFFALLIFLTTIVFLVKLMKSSGRGDF